LLRYQSILFTLLVFFSFVLFSAQTKAQDTLPNFSVLFVNNKIIVRWINNNIKINQVNIQRSSDVSTGFKTIAAIEQPSMNLFEFIDTKAINEFQSYRLYITEEGGNYQFTKSQKPELVEYNVKTTFPKSNTILENKKIDSLIVKKSDEGTLNNVKVESNRIYFISNNPTRYAKIAENISQIKLKLSNKADSSYPHVYSFVNQQGQFEIAQAFVKTKHVNFVFYKDDGTKLFVLNNVKENQFVLDKTNFLVSGWFYFEMFENDKLITKQKFYLPK